MNCWLSKLTITIWYNHALICFWLKSYFSSIISELFIRSTIPQACTELWMKEGSLSEHYIVVKWVYHPKVELQYSIPVIFPKKLKASFRLSLMRQIKIKIGLSAWGFASNWLFIVFIWKQSLNEGILDLPVFAGVRSQ